MSKYSCIQWERVVLRDDAASLTEDERKRAFRNHDTLEYKIMDSDSRKRLAFAEEVGQQIDKMLAGAPLQVDNCDGLHARINQWGDIDIRLRRRLKREDLK